MCGISGHFLFDPSSSIDIHRYYRSHNLMKHRGPDDEGYIALDRQGREVLLRGDDTVTDLKSLPHCLDSSKPIQAILGHRRLSILDLSALGHQPMGDTEAGIWVVFNGEIYNYLELRAELQAKGFSFKSRSDTEVLLRAYQAWGRSFVEKLDGMWAFALLDSRKQELLLSRDRAGMKPLYYHSDGSQFMFASEMRFLKSQMGSISMNRLSAYQYLQDSLIENSGDTIYTGIHQLRPAELMVVNYRNGRMERQPYWDPLKAKTTRRFTEHEVFAALSHSIDIHFRSDVPVGVLLSGGLDSTAIATLASHSYSKPDNPLRTFSLVYQEEEFSERRLIEKTVQAIRSQHYWAIPPLDRLSERVMSLLRIQEIPVRSLAVFSQQSLMNTVSQEHVKVVLGGQGADELFGGYSYYNARAIAEYVRHFELGHAFREYRLAYPRTRCSMRDILGSLKFAYAGYHPYRIHRNALLEDPGITRPPVENIALSGDIFWDCLYLDFFHRALPEYLHYEDRNSMSVSIESRLPFLGKDMLDIGFHMPMDQKINKGIRKSLLRDSLAGKISDEIRLDRDKKGFISPQNTWHHTVFKPALDEFFLSTDLKDVPLLKTAHVRNYYKAYTEQQHNDWGTIWRFYCFGQWIKQMNTLTL